MSAPPFLPVRWRVTTPDMADDPDIFPLLPGQMFVASKGPAWSTNVKRTKSRREFRNGEWAYPEWRFKVSYEVLREKPGMYEFQRLMAFFNKRKGKLGEFYYYDPTDHTCTDEFIGFGDGMNVTYQLVRRLSDWEEPVFAVYGDPILKINGIATTDFTLNDFGVVVFDDPPSSGQTVTWTGEFMYWCRFDQDDLSAMQMSQRMWSQDGLSFISLTP